MSNAGNLEDELGGLDIVSTPGPSPCCFPWAYRLPVLTCLRVTLDVQNELPPELQEEARQDKEKKSQGGYRCADTPQHSHSCMHMFLLLCMSLSCTYDIN